MRSMKEVSAMVKAFCDQPSSKDDNIATAFIMFLSFGKKAHDIEADALKDLYTKYINVVMDNFQTEKDIDAILKRCQMPAIKDKKIKQRALRILATLVAIGAIEGTNK